MAPSGEDIRLEKKILLYLKQMLEDFHPACLRQIAESPEYQRLVNYCLPDHLATAESTRNQRSSEEDASRETKRAKHHNTEKSKDRLTQSETADFHAQVSINSTPVT